MPGPYTAYRRKKRLKLPRTPGSSSFFVRGFRDFSIWTIVLLLVLLVAVGSRSFPNQIVEFAYNNDNQYFADLLTPVVLPNSESFVSRAPPQQQRVPPFPRILRYDFENNDIVPMTNNSYFEYNLRYTNAPEDSSSRPVVVRRFNLGDIRKKCIPMDDWQTSRFLSCNNFHDMNMDQIQFINCGGSRCAFKFFDIDGTPQVLKTQFFGGVNEQDMEYARKDALALERLTKSPYVTNIYGSCGMTQTLEYSAYGNLFDWMKLTRAKERELPSPLERLKFGIQVSTAVADVHSINEADGFVSMTHNDICCHQFMHVDGIFKLGDFHLSKFHEKHKLTGQACNTTNFPMNAVLKKVRAPEEMYGQVQASQEKIDVYLVGNLLYYIMTRRWMFEGITTDEAISKLKNGQRSELGFEPTDPADTAMAKAINWTWTQDSEKRPKAREVSNFLKRSLREIEGRDEDYVVRVPIPPLPDDYDFSDAQFYENLGMDLDGNFV